MIEIRDVTADPGEGMRLGSLRPVARIEQPAAVLVIEDLLLRRQGLRAGVEVLGLEHTQRPHAGKSVFHERNRIVAVIVGDLVGGAPMLEDKGVGAITPG